MLALICALFMMVSVFAGCTVVKDDTDEDKAKYVVLEDNFGDELYGIGFRNGEIALGLEIQKHLDEMIADGTAKTISEKWFGKDSLLKDQPFIEESEASEGDNSLQKILDKGKLILGLDDSFPPMGFRDSDGVTKGFDIDLATEVVKRMGVELVLQPVNWNIKETELDAGKVDCLWNGMTINPTRIGKMYFTKPYIENRQIIIVSDKSGIKKKSDLEGKKVGLQKGSSAVDAVKEDAIHDKLTLSEYADNVAAYNDLKIGRIDALVVDEVVGRYILSQDNK